MAQECINRMKDYIRKHYSDYTTKTNFYPSVTLTRISGETKIVAKERKAYVTNYPLTTTSNKPKRKRKSSPSSISERHGVPGAQESHTREDLSLYKVLHFLRALTNERNEPMFVISQLKFSSYLGELGFAESLNLLLPKHLEEKYRQGDFDILLIHRHYGMLVGEIKSVMSNQQGLDRSQQEIDFVISEKIRQAIKQTNKLGTVVHEITKDLTSKVPIQKRIFLPYVTRSDLQRILSSDEKLSQVNL